MAYARVGEEVAAILSVTGTAMAVPVTLRISKVRPLAPQHRAPRMNPI